MGWNLFMQLIYRKDIIYLSYYTKFEANAAWTQI